jgi:hypothetical protein
MSLYPLREGQSRPAVNRANSNMDFEVIKETDLRMVKSDGERQDI